MPNSKKLYLTTVDPGFSPEQADVIGPWCFQGAEGVYPGWDKLFFVEPFSDPAAICREAANAETYTNYLIGHLGRSLNERHGVDYDFSFWHSVHIGWVGVLTLFITARYRHIQDFLEKYGATPYNADLLELQGNLRFPVSRAVSDALNDPVFDWWITSKIMKAILPTHIHMNAVTREDYTPPEHYPGPDLGRSFPRLGSLYQVPVWWFMAFNGLIQLVRKTPPREKPAARASHAPADPVLRDVLEQIVSACVPESFGADFSLYNDIALHQTYKKGKVRISSSDIHDESLSFVNAHAHRAGEIVGYVQHGSFYGIVAPFNQGIGSEYAKSFFLTWGWDRHEGFDGRFIPLPLSPFAKRRKRGKNLLFLANVNNTFKHTLSGQAPPGVVVQERHDKAAFFETLRDDIRFNSYYRPHIFHAGIDDAVYLQNKELVENILTHRDIDEYINNARLSVSNCYGSTLHKTLAQNTPTIAYFKDFPPLTPAAQLAFDDLRRVGIVHDDAQSAARFINDKWDSLDTWWQADETQAAIKKWCRINMRTSRFWFLSWIKFILFYKFA